MKTFEIEFTTLGGNTQSVLVDAYSQLQAIRTFEKNYAVDEILNIEEIEIPEID